MQIVIHEMKDVTDIMVGLDEKSVKLAEIDAMQKKLQRSAAELSRLRTYMIHKISQEL